jgi:hypothetical protein
MEKRLKKIQEKINVNNIFKILINISLILALIRASLEREWIIVFVTIAVLILISSPYFLRKKYKIHIPEELEILIIILIYSSIFLGEVHDYYTLFWWWDALLHTFSGIVLGLIGFILLRILYQEEKIKARPFIIVLFSFCFALALGSLWEIFEFAMDSLFGLNMQKSGLLDTMGDLIADSIGAFIVCLFGYIYLKRKEGFLFKKIIKDFMTRNSYLFRN